MKLKWGISPIFIFIAVILLLVVVSLFLLFRPQGKQSIDNKEPGQRKPLYTEEFFKQGQILAISEKDSPYNLTLENVDDLKTILEGWDLFGKKYQRGNVSTGETPLYALDVVLTDSEPQTHHLTYGSSAYLLMLKGRVVAFILEDEEVVESKDAGDYIAENLFGLLFMLTNNASQSEAETAAKEAVEQLNNTGNRHFVVSRK